MPRIDGSGMNGGYDYDAFALLRRYRPENNQTKMDVIGNNIANVNTVGFKGSRVTFRKSSPRPSEVQLHLRTTRRH